LALTNTASNLRNKCVKFFRPMMKWHIKTSTMVIKWKKGWHLKHLIPIA
jgi:hypothetical protein